MTRLDELISDELTAIANSSPVPADLAERAIAGGRRRRRRIGATLAGAVSAVGLTLVLVGVSLSGGLAPAAPAKANALFAWYEAVGLGKPAWHVLDPDSGQFRVINVATVTAPTTDLRYAAVSAPFVTSVNAAVSPERRIGRYDTTTGDIRWYDIPVLLGTAPRISPDGRYAAAAADNPSDRPEEAFAKVVVLDLTTGRATVVDLGPADAAAAVYTINGLPAGFHPGDGLTWRPDSRHLMVGNAIVDLAGRHTGILPLPPGNYMLSVRPDGAGALIKKARWPVSLQDAMNDPPLEVTDASGAVAYRVTLGPCDPNATPVRPIRPTSFPSVDSSPGASSNRPPLGVSPGASGTALPASSGVPPYTPSPGSSSLPSFVDTCSSTHNVFVGWRGNRAMLVLNGSTLPSTVDEVDLATGARHGLVQLARPYDDMSMPYEMVIVPADALSDRARGQVGF